METYFYRVYHGNAKEEIIYLCFFLLKKNESRVPNPDAFFIALLPLHAVPTLDLPPIRFCCLFFPHDCHDEAVFSAGLINVCVSEELCRELQ
mmetsp:Transcript_17541/g.35220  ORF Transcript_17541/g.35220 Transcript_17541/m.35220 type:complete len:92 (+) Transcript_17541:1229-1504(+)